MGCDIVEEERALPFLGAALTERQKPAEPAVSRPIGRIGEQAWRILQIEPGADDEFDAGFLGGDMGAHRPASVLRSVTAMAARPKAFAVATSSSG